MPNFGFLTPEIPSNIFLITSHSTQSRRGIWELLHHDNDTRAATVFLEPSSTSSPSTLSRVCRHWHRVALSTPRLWSHIKLQVGCSLASYRIDPQVDRHRLPWWIAQDWSPGLENSPDNEESWIKYWNLVLVWLQRSRNVPLRLYVILNPNKSLPPGLLETIARWDVIHIVGTDRRYRLTKLVDLPVNAQLLEKAKILECLEIDLNISAQEMRSIISCLPNLQHLRTSSEVSLVPGESYTLESLSVICWGLEVCLRTFCSFPNLRTLDITLDNNDMLPPTTTLILPQLTDLTIEGNSIIIAEFLSEAEFPSLQLAKFTATDDYSDCCVETYEELFLCPLAKFLKRNPSKRIGLGIYMATLQEDHAIELLQAAPYLTSLELDLYNLTDNGLHYLTCGSQQTLCPDLLTLKLSICEDCNISIEQLTNMIDSRFKENQEMIMELDLNLCAEERKCIMDNPDFRRVCQRISDSSRSNLAFIEAADVIELLCGSTDRKC